MILQRDERDEHPPSRRYHYGVTMPAEAQHIESPFDQLDLGQADMTFIGPVQITSLKELARFLMPTSAVEADQLLILYGGLSHIFHAAPGTDPADIKYRAALCRILSRGVEKYGFPPHSIWTMCVEDPEKAMRLYAETLSL